MSVDIFGCSSNHINFEIDGKEYILLLQEVKDGEHWSDYLCKVKRGQWVKMSDADGVYWSCSECGEDVPRVSHYCPNCGKRMEVE